MHKIPLIPWYSCGDGYVLLWRGIIADGQSLISNPLGYSGMPTSASGEPRFGFSGFVGLSPTTSGESDLGLSAAAGLYQTQVV